jgi:hypothetical protein
LEQLATVSPPPPSHVRLPEAKPDPEKEYPVRRLAIRSSEAEPLP